MKNFMVSCDWGTTKFRLCLVNRDDFTVDREIITKDGILGLFNKWKEETIQSGITLKDYYLGVLKTHLDKLLEDAAAETRSLSVVISGMASSKAGIAELPYATLPFSLDGKDAVTKCIVPSQHFPFEIILISGVMAHDDVMRGEETQMVGIANLESTLLTADEAICIFPGTHSKHIRISKGNIASFKTYLTGELFQLLSTHSVLQGAVASQDNSAVLEERNMQAFYNGIAQSNKESNLLNKLFTVRTNELMGMLSRQENYFYLSGLLIGYEIRALQQEKTCPVFLCSGNNMFHLYRLAIEKLWLGVPVKNIAPDLMDRAAISGQLKILQNHHPLK
jgi:2-dehydro-3-deoxygalactonokinase